MSAGSVRDVGPVEAVPVESVPVGAAGTEAPVAADTGVPALRHGTFRPAAPLRPRSLPSLQRRAGNRAVTQLVRSHGAAGAGRVTGGGRAGTAVAAQRSPGSMEGALEVPGRHHPGRPGSQVAGGDEVGPGDLGAVHCLGRGEPSGEPVAMQRGWRNPLDVVKGVASGAAALGGRAASAVGDLAGRALGPIKARIAGLANSLRSGWSGMRSGSIAAIRGVTSSVSSGIRAVTNLGTAIGGRIRSGFTTARGTLSALAGGMRRMVAGGLGTVRSAAAGLRQALGRMDATSLRTAWTRMTGALGSVLGRVQGARQALTQRVAALWTRLHGGFGAGITSLRARAGSVLTQLRNGARGVSDRLTGMWNGLKTKADSMGGIVGAIARIAARLVETLLAGVRRFWDGLRSQWDALKRRIAGLATMIGERLAQARDAMHRRATALFDGLRRTWESAKGTAARFAGRAVGVLAGFAGRTRGLGVGQLVGKVAKISALLALVRQAPASAKEALDDWAERISSVLHSQMPSAAVQQASEHSGGGGSSPAGTATTTPAIALHRQASPGEAQLDQRSTLSFSQTTSVVGDAIEKKWAQVKFKDMIVQVLRTLLWPWPTVIAEFKGIWTDWRAAAGGLFQLRGIGDFGGFLHDLWSNLLHLVDFPLIVWRRLNSMAMALMGWVTIALVLVGAIGGTAIGGVIGGIVGFFAGLGIGAAPGGAAGAGAGGLTGAFAGLGASAALGQGLLLSFIAAEVTAITKALAELLTARQSHEEQTSDSNAVADSALGLGVAALLFALSWIASKIGGAVLAFVRRVRIEREAGPAAAPPPVTAKGRYAAMKARTAERGRASAMQEGIARLDAEIAAGKKTVLVKDLEWLNANPRHKALAYDPGGNGQYRVTEAKQALAAERQGILAGPVARSANSGADFADGTGKDWSFKGTGPGSTVENTVDKIIGEVSAGRNCVADLTALDPAQQALVRGQVSARVRGISGGGELRFNPPGLPPVVVGAGVIGAQAGDPVDRESEPVR